MRMKKKQILSFLMTIAMVFNIAPFSAAAEEGNITFSSEPQTVMLPGFSSGELEVFAGSARIVVRYGEDAKIPATAKLQASAITTGETYTDCKQQLNSMYADDDTGVVIAGLYSLSILNGEEIITPEADVDVSITLPDDTGIAKNNLHLVRFGDETKEITDPGVSGTTVSFRDNSLSVYGIASTNDLRYRIYLEPGQKEFSLRGYFDKKKSLGTELLDSIWDNYKCYMYFFDSTGDYVFDYSYSYVSGAANQNKDIIVKLLDTIPANEYIEISFYDFAAGKWVNNLNGRYISIRFIAPPAGNAAYHDDMFWYDLNTDDPDHITAAISGIYDEYKGNTLEISSVTRDENAYPVSVVPKNAFKDNSTIASVVFKNEKEIQVQDGAFRSMSALETVQFNGTGRVDIGSTDWNGPFGYCTALTSVTGAEESSVSFNAMGIFQGCTLLKTVRLGNVDRLYQNTFMDNNSLETFEANNIKEINTQAFNRCTGLRIFKVNGNAGTIGTWAFDGCSQLNSAEIGGDLGTAESWAFGNVNALDTFIVLGDTGTLKSDAVHSETLRVAVLKGKAGKLERSAFSGTPFAQENNLIYVGKAGGYDSINGYAFGGSNQRGKAYFNFSYDDLYSALGNRAPYSSLYVKNYRYSDQDCGTDVYIREGGTYGYGTSASDAWNSFSTAMYSMYNNSESADRFRRDCAAAGAENLGLVFYGDLKPDTDGFVLHVFAAQGTGTANFPADMYGEMLESHSSITGAPKTFGNIKEIIFEKDAGSVNIPEGAMRKFTNLQAVRVLNEDAAVTIGKDAFAGLSVKTICPAEQTVTSGYGTVTLAKGVNAPIGTSLTMVDSSEDYTAAVLESAKANGLFDGVPEAQIRICAYDLFLTAPDGNRVNAAAKVQISRKISDYTGSTTIAPKEFAFFHIEGSSAKMVTDEFTANLDAGTIAYSFETDGFSPYAAAYTLDVNETGDGVFTYLTDNNGNATITGYDQGFSGNALKIPGETVIDGTVYKVIGIADNALVSPPERITSIVFTNEDPLNVGSGALSGLKEIGSISFSGSGTVTFNDTTAFDGSGTESVAVSMPNGLTARTGDGACGAVFSGLAGTYHLTADNVSRIPDNAFKNDKKVASVTILSALENNGEFKPAYVSSNRANFNTNAIGKSAFEGATGLASFRVEGSTGTSIAIGNEAFRDCASLAELSIADKIAGLGEQALSYTGFTSLTLNTDNAEIGKEALAYIPGLNDLVIQGGIYGTGSRFLGGSGADATKLRTLVFDGAVTPQLYNQDIRGERLSVLVFRNGGTKGITDHAIYMEGAREAQSLTVYVDGSLDDNPYISDEAFPENQDIRIFLDLPIPREKAHQSNGLAELANIRDLAYSADQAPTDFYVNTELTESGVAVFNSYEDVKEAVKKTYNAGGRFRGYFAEAGFDTNGLNLPESEQQVTEYTLHIIGKTSSVDDSLAGDLKLKGVEIQLDSGCSIAIADGAFRDCANLAAIDFNAVRNVEIGKASFENCTKLEEFYIQYKYDLTIGEEAFKGCSMMDTLTIDGLDNVVIQANAFEGTALQEVNILRGYKDTTIEADAFRGVDSITAVTLASLFSSRLITIGENAFADCGEMENVLIINSAEPVIGSNAFGGDRIGIVRIDGGSGKIAEGAFDGGETYIDGGDNFNSNLAAKTGPFENVILTRPQSISADAQIFAGNDALKLVYLSSDSNTAGISGGIFAGMTDQADAFIALKRTDFTEESRPNRANGTIRFLDDSEYLFIDGTNKNDNPDGSENNGFRTFAEAKASLAKKSDAAKSGNRTGTGDYYYTDVADVLRKAYKESGLSVSEREIRFGIPDESGSSRGFYVKGTVTVREDETWESDEGETISLLRYDGFTGPMVQLEGGTLSLKNLILDGLNLTASAPLIDSNSEKTTIEIHEGAQLLNNDNSLTERWINNEYSGGGAIHTTGTVIMDGGVISGNKASYGGGVHVSGGTFNMSGGVIEGNTAYLAYSGNNVTYSCGGGVLMTRHAVMNMSGSASVSGNTAEHGSGAGICLGAMYAANDSNYATLNMTSGSISGNTSEFEGGGLYVQMGSKAYVSGGSFTGNTCLGGVASPNYGGGAVYVNGTHNLYKFPDGELHLTRALITGNHANIAGGAISGCGTSTTKIYLANGTAIYGNSAGDNADLNLDYESYWAYYGYSPACMTATVSPYMFNGTPCNWTDAATGEKIPEAKLAYLTGNTFHLRANPGEGAPTTGNVIFSGNTSKSRGGAIGTNGTVIIGDEPEPRVVSWKPEADKVLLNRDMKEGETFTFRLYEEKTSEGLNFWWTRYEDVPVATGSVTGGKDGKPAAIEFSPEMIGIGEVSAEDIGTRRTFLLIEDQPENDVTASGRYLAFVVSIALVWDNEQNREVLSAETLEIEEGRIGEDGKPEYENTISGTVSPDATAENNFGRIRSKASKAVLENYAWKTDISAEKKWLNHDGSTTPPAGASVVLELYADGNPTGERITLDGAADEDGESSPWTATWKDLDIFHTEEEPVTRISYSIKEISVTPSDRFEIIRDPVAADSSTGYALLTNREKVFTERTVRKEWDDDGNRDGMRPRNIRVTLTANGNMVQTVTLSDENGWSATIRELPAETDGETIRYAWREAEVTNYTQANEETTGTVTVFTNRLIRVPEETPPDEPRPRVPGRRWYSVIIEDYSTPLGGEILINHVGDCFD